MYSSGMIKYFKVVKMKRIYFHLFNIKKIQYSALILISVLLLSFPECIAQNLNSPNKKGPMGIEVNTHTGNLFLSRNDIYIPARELDFDISFSYNSFNSTENKGYGNGWIFMYGMQYKIDSATRISIIWSDGREDKYLNNGNGFISPVGIFDSLSQYQTGKYLLKTTGGMKYYFDNNSHKRLTKMQESNGNFLNFGYTDSLVTSITNTAGQTITLNYTNGKLSSITDANAIPSQTYNYSYDAAGNLTKVTDPMGSTIKYSYLVNGPMSAITDKNNNVVDIIYYPDFSARELISCNTRTAFSYDTTVRTTTVIDFVPTSSNQVSTYVFNEKGWLSNLVGSCCGYNMTFTYDNIGNLIARKDANGNVYKYTYDNKGNYLTISDPQNSITSYTYSPDFNNITSVTDPLGNVYSINYDAAGNTTMTTQPGNRQNTFTYTASGDLSTAKDENNNTTNFLYDAYGYPQKITMPLNTQLESTFDARGNLLSSKDANGNLYSYQYDSLNRIKKLIDPLNHILSLNYDKVGNITSYTDAKGNKSLLLYDASNRVVTMKDAMGATMILTYDDLHNLVSVTDALGKSTTFNYDNQNRLTTVTDAVGNSHSFNYDAAGNMISSVNPIGNTENYIYDGLNRVVGKSDDTGAMGNTTYDANGRVISLSNSNGASINMTYDNMDRLTKLTDPLGNSRVFVYDNEDNLLSIKDRNNHISSYTYNALNRVTSFTDNNNNQITPQYDVMGNVTKITDQNGNSTTYEYDLLNRPTKTILPDGSNTTITYDNNNNIVLKKLTDGSNISYSYDSTNKLVSKDLPGGEHFSYTYDAKKRLISASNASGIVSFTYDNIDSIVSETFNTHVITYDYNLSGRRITTTYPSGTIITKSFDKRSRLTGVTVNNQQLVNYQYNNLNQFSKKNYSNGVITDYQYDNVDRLSSISSNRSNLPSLFFQYDNEMNKTVVGRYNDPQYSETFSYDNKYRLINYKQGVYSGSTISSPLIQNSYTYDAVGNRLSANLNGIFKAYTVNNLNQYTSAGTTNFIYDGNGNQIFDGNYNMQYDAEGRKLVDSIAGNIYRYQYDAFGRRSVKSFNGTLSNFYYAGLRQIEERNSSDVLVANQIYDFMPLVRNYNNKKYFYHHNDLTSTEAVTDSVGNLIEHYRYEDFGKTSFFNAQNNSIANSTINNRFLYTSQEYDTHDSVYQFHYRNYNPTIGNFSQRDPIGYADQMGMYQYVGNNPGSNMDPLGLAPCPPETKTWDQWGSFWGGELSNLGSFLQIFESSPQAIQKIQKMGVVQFLRNGKMEEGWGLINKAIPLVGAERATDILSKGSKLVNSPLATASSLAGKLPGVGMLLINGYNTFEAGKGLADWSNTSGAERLDNGLNLVSASSTTAVGTIALASPAALTAGALAGAPIVAGTVGTAGGLALYGIADLGFRGLTGAAGMVGIGGGQESIIGFSGNHDIPIYTWAIRSWYQQQGTSADVGNRWYQKMNHKLKKWDRIQEEMEQRHMINKMKHFYSMFQSNDCPPNNDNHGTQKPNPYNFVNSLIKFLTELIFNHDPNAIIGPDGVGNNKWVSINDRLPYSILFQNDTSATAPVKVVKVIYPIDPKQDASTFQLGSFGFNNQTYNIPATNSYYQRLDVRDSLGLFVDVTAGVDPVKNQAFWIFESIDPVTLLPSSEPLKGFLSITNPSNPNAGHGFVNFTIKPITTAHTKDTISAIASILFDLNDTIPTNRTRNTIDALPPVSHLDQTVQNISPNTVRISWHGDDDPGGSGVASYSLYVSTNNNPFTLYRSQLTATSLLFTGIKDSMYCFFVAAKDSVKNQEALSNNCDLRIIITSSPLPITWLDFTGNRRGDDALLRWSTTNEINARSYRIERSLDGITFNAIGNINANGNRNGINNYNFTDRGIINLGVNIIYYRIREVDIDGRGMYSRTIAIRLDNTLNAPLISAFPNPFSQQITLQVTPISPQDKTSSVEMYSSHGELLYKKEINKLGSATIILNDLPALPSGMYILKTMVNGIPYTNKMIKN